MRNETVCTPTQRLQKKLEELSCDLDHVPEGAEAIEGLRTSLQDVISELESFKSSLGCLCSQSKKAA